MKESVRARPAKPIISKSSGEPPLPVRQLQV